MLLEHLREQDLGRSVFHTDVGEWSLHDEASAISKLAEAMGAVASDRDGLLAILRDKAPLCLVIDEADRMLREPWSGNLLAWMRWLIGGNGLYTELVFVLAGGPMLMGYEDPDDAGSPALNISKKVLLRPFARDDVEAMVALGQAEVDVDWLLTYAGGHPWLLNQLLCELEDGASQEAALQEALDQCHDTFPVWVRQLGARGEAFLRALPPEGVEHSKLDSHARLGLRPARHLCLVREVVEEKSRRYLRGPRLFFDDFAAASVPESWDLAISYASEDLEMARRIKQGMASEFRVFFAPDEEAWMWGEDLARVLPKLYGVESRFVLVLSTKAYCDKHWTRVEFDAARGSKNQLLVVNLGQLPENMPEDVVYRNGSRAQLVGLLDDLRTRIRS